MSAAALDRPALHDLDRALATEWLETDGVGGFASTTVVGCATRRYHGLLVARPPDLRDRHVFLSRFDDRLTDLHGKSSLSVARYRGGVLAPRGDLLVERFDLGPTPTTTFRTASGVEVRRTVLMPKGRAATLCRWQIKIAPEPVTLEIRPLLACRPADSLHTKNDALDTHHERPSPAVVAFRPYPALPAVSLTVSSPNGFRYHHDPVWDERVEYAEDLRRGYDGLEDQWSPGWFVAHLKEGDSLLIATALGEPVREPERLWSRVRSLRKAAAIVADERGDSTVRTRLSRTADDFLYVAPTGRLGICAGFPWFEEWGRDLFVALPGLTLARGRVAQCGQVLEGTLEFLKDGLLPNVFGDGVADSTYDSADAALWFARAVRMWADHGGADGRLLEAFRPALEEIVHSYLDGTALAVRADDAMMLHAGDPDRNATWMDARTSAGPVTPRYGCAVEINALWFSLLDHCAELAELAGDRAAAASFAERRTRCGRGFVERLWLDGDGYLADRWTDGHAIAEVRPNMVLAAALAASPLTDAMRRGVLARADAELLTPRGLRTLAPSDPAYRGVYAGGPEERDRAYHQGTVWPWLLGSYVEACLLTRGTDETPRLRELLDGFAAELDRAGLDQVSEVFDGDAPHRPGGTIAQAWNTGELLRAYALLDVPPVRRPATG